MARKIYDASERIIPGTDEFPIIMFAGQEFIIDPRKSKWEQVTKMQSNEEDSDESTLIRFILGEEQANKLDELDLTISQYKTFMTYVMASVYDISYEDAEKRFQL